MSDSCNPVECSSPGTSVFGILQARILEWVALLQGIFLTQGLNLCHLYLLHCQFFFLFFFLPLAPKGHVNLPTVGSSCSALMLSGQWTSPHFIGMGLSREARQVRQLLLLWSVRPCPCLGKMCMRMFIMCWKWFIVRFCPHESQPIEILWT